MAKFFSGFSLQGESELFKEYIVDSEFCISGFSFGGIKAFEACRSAKSRVDLLQLFSPAFFQDRDEKFKRVQLINYKKDSKRYIDNFLKSCSEVASLQKYRSKSSYEELKELLYYRWDKESLEEVRRDGVNIEVYIGEDDRVVDSSKSVEFFRKFADVYFFRGADHLLLR